MRDPSLSLDSVEGRLVAEAGEGDTAALGLLYERYSSDVYRVALRISGSPTDALDVTQDVFLNLPEIIGNSYEELGRFRPWLLRVTARTALMKNRRRKHRREALSSNREVVARRRAPDDPIDRVALERAVESLPEDLRIVFILKTEGYCHAEIASVLEISEGASRVRLCRAHKRLRGIL